MIGCMQVAGGCLRRLGAKVMGFHCAKLQIVPRISGLDGAAILHVRLGVPLIGSCVKRLGLMPVGLFFSQNKHILPRDLLFFRICGFFCPLSICTFVAALQGGEKMGYFRNTNPNRKHFIPTAALKLVCQTSWQGILTRLAQSAHVFR